MIPSLVGLYNGRSGAALYKLGAMYSTDRGVSWTREATNPVLEEGSGWESSFVVQPALVWDGTQYVVYYAGFNGSSIPQIGRATSTDLITWTKYGSNPVVAVGGSGAIDEDGCNLPIVHFDPSESPPWKMWYAAWDGTLITVAHADSTNGTSWTKRGRVINVGSSGAFDDVETVPSAVIKVGPTWYVYYAGRSSTGIPPSYRNGLATCTTPATAGTYTKQGVSPGLSGTITLSDGLTYDSNQIRTIFPRSSDYLVMGSVFHPTTGPYLEKTFMSTTTDLVTFTTPTGPVLPLVGGQWDETSAENPSIIQAPAS